MANGDFSLFALLTQMGVTATVVVAVLALLSVWSLAISVERTIVFARARRQSLAFVRTMAESLRRGGAEAVVATAARFPHSHLARVVSAGLVTYRQKRTVSGLGPDQVVAAAERAVERAALLVAADLRRGVGSLATIATTAPFIGLFGTVVGIIHAFRDMSLAGAGGLAVVSQGISEALATTALGLFVALPAAWMFNVFTHRIERLGVEMANSASELADFFAEERAGI